MSDFELADGVRWWAKRKPGFPVRVGIKRGDRRDDGLYFYGYKRNGPGETWVSERPHTRGYEVVGGVRWWFKTKWGAPAREGIKRGDRRVDGLYFNGYIRGGTGENWVSKCPRLKSKEANTTNGGFTSPSAKRLFEEDQALYNCYVMLSSTGLGRNEVNARWLFDTVMPKDGKCPCCGKEMKSNAGRNLGSGKRQAPSLNSPSIEHVIPKSHPKFHLYDEASLLRIVCYRCNVVMNNATPDELRQAADWREHAQSQMKRKDENEERQNDHDPNI